MLSAVLDRLPLNWFVRLALLRLIAQWRSILTIIIGVILTTMIGASVPLYTNAVAQIGLIQRLDQQPDADVQVFSRVSASADSDENLLATWADFDRTIQAESAESLDRFSGWWDETINWGETVSMIVVRDGEDIPDKRVRLGYYAGLEDQVEIVEGTWPQSTSNGSIEVALTELVASAFNLSVGDRVMLDQRGWDTSRPIEVHVSGILRERDPQAPYWFAPSPLRIESTAQAPFETNFITTRAVVERVAVDFVPQTRLQFGWRILFDNAELPFDDIAAAQTTINTLRNQFGSALEAAAGERVSLVLNTNIAAVLSDYEEEVELLGAPFGLLLLQIAALVLFFLIVIGALVRRSERREIVMLKSRGTTNRQILVLRTVEAAIVCALAALIAPWLARQFLIFLMPVFTDIDSLPLSISSETHLYAAGAALAALVILVVTLIPVLRSPLIIAAGATSRDQGQAWWQRYYLDVILLLIGFAALVQMVNNDTLLASTTGDTQSDPLLLLAPTLLVFALGSVSLRLFPLAMQAISRILNQRRHIEPTLASWQVSRESLHYGRIAFLLALAISIGWFAVSFQRTVTRSLIDQAEYEVGSNLRLNYPQPARDPSADVAALSDVTAASNVLRLADQDLSTRSGDLTFGDVLAVDAATFGEAALWRNSLGPLTLPAWEQPPPQSGRTLPETAERIGMWVMYQGIVANPATPFGGSPGIGIFPPRLIENITMTLRLRDPEGRVLSAELTPQNTQEITTFYAEIFDDLSQEDAFTLPEADAIPGGGWIYFTADLSQIETDGLLRIDGISFATNDIGNFQGNNSESRLLLRDLTLETGDTTQILDWLANSDTWTFVNIVSALSDPADINRELPTPEINDERLAQSLSVEWAQNAASAQFSLLLDYVTVVSSGTGAGGEITAAEITGLPAFVSRSYAASESLAIGQKFRVFLQRLDIWFEVAGIVDYYPTLYGDEKPFIVTDRDMLLHTLRAAPLQLAQPGELWLRLTDNTTETRAFTALNTQTDYDFTIAASLSETLDSRRADLLSIGLIGLLYFSSLTGFVLSAVTLLTYISLNVQDRRTELVVLRALGLTTRRLVFSIAIEQLFVIVIGLFLGIGIGLLLSTQVLPTLSVSTTGDDITPPFVVQTELPILLQYILGILALLVAQLIISSLLVRRLTTTTVLRTTGE